MPPMSLSSENDWILPHKRHRRDQMASMASMASSSMASMASFSPPAVRPVPSNVWLTLFGGGAIVHQGARGSAIALRTYNKLKELRSACLKLYTCASNGNRRFCMRTNVSLTSNIPRRRARFYHDAIDDGHAKHGLQMRTRAAWLSLTTPILTASMRCSA